MDNKKQREDGTMTVFRFSGALSEVIEVDSLDALAMRAHDEDFEKFLARECPDVPGVTDEDEEYGAVCPLEEVAYGEREGAQVPVEVEVEVERPW